MSLLPQQPPTSPTHVSPLWSAPPPKGRTGGTVFAVIGIATVPVLGLCGRRIVGATPSVLAAWFLAIDPFHVFWSQNARGYAIVVLASVAMLRSSSSAARALSRLPACPGAA